MTGAANVPLPEVVFFQEGPGLRKWQWTDDGMKVINVTNILGDAAGTVDVTNTDKFISLVEFEEKYQHFAVEKGDFVVASSGNTYGKVGKVSEPCLPLMMNTSVVRFHSLNPERLDNRYLYAFLRSPDFRNQVERFVIGGAQPNFGPSHLKKMTMPLPGIDKQKSIASILSAYDDLIENNRRRIQLLEQAARLLYKEWFVHFRFPGHEHIKIHNGIPEGWEKTTVGDVSSFISRGITTKYDDEATGTVINQKCIRDGRVTMELTRRQSKEVPPNKLLRYGDVLVNSTGQGTLGRVAQFLDEIENCTVDSHVTIARPGAGVPILLYGYHIASMEEYLASMGRGATNQTELSKDVMAELSFLRPPHFLAEQFELFIKKNADQVRNLTKQKHRTHKST